MPVAGSKIIGKAIDETIAASAHRCRVSDACIGRTDELVAHTHEILARSRALLGRVGRLMTVKW